MALINIAGKTYELVLENKAGFNLEAFRNRYSEVLERYDFIVGDWGYNQLRLKGFFRDGSNKATKDTTFAFATDYLNEYCNFGCAYFILEKKFDQNENEQNQDEFDPLLADIEDDYELTGTYSAHKNNEADDDDNFEQAEIKTIKPQHINQKQHTEKQQSHTKGNDKPSKRRTFKHRNNKNNANTSNNTNQNQHVINDAEPTKEPIKKNKRRSNKPFKHFDRKKNKEHANSAQE